MPTSPHQVFFILFYILIFIWVFLSSPSFCCLSFFSFCFLYCLFFFFQRWGAVVFFSVSHLPVSSFFHLMYVLLSLVTTFFVCVCVCVCVCVYVCVRACVRACVLGMLEPKANQSAFVKVMTKTWIDACQGYNFIMWSWRWSDFHHLISHAEASWARYSLIHLSREQLKWMTAHWLLRCTDSCYSLYFIALCCILPPPAPLISRPHPLPPPIFHPSSMHPDLRFDWLYDDWHCFLIKLSSFGVDS